MGVERIFASSTETCTHSFGYSQIFFAMSPVVQIPIQSTPRYILTSVFLLVAHALLTDCLSLAFHEYETSKAPSYAAEFAVAALAIAGSADSWDSRWVGRAGLAGSEFVETCHHR